MLGFANAGIWAPLSSTATRNLPPRQAGAGSGVYNTTRQIGAVLGSAAIAVLIQARLAAELPAGPGGCRGGQPDAFGGALPEALHEGFSTAMGQSILLPAAVILLGAAVALFFAKPKPVQGWGEPGTCRGSVSRRQGRRRAAPAEGWPVCCRSAQQHTGLDAAGGEAQAPGDGQGALVADVGAPLQRQARGERLMGRNGGCQ